MQALHLALLSEFASKHPSPAHKGPPSPILCEAKCAASQRSMHACHAYAPARSQMAKSMPLATISQPSPLEGRCAPMSYRGPSFRVSLSSIRATYLHATFPFFLPDEPLQADDNGAMAPKAVVPGLWYAT